MNIFNIFIIAQRKIKKGLKNEGMGFSLVHLHHQKPKGFQHLHLRENPPMFHYALIKTKVCELDKIMECNTISYQAKALT